MSLGDWNGNACRNFLGISRSNATGACSDYKDVVALLLTLISGKANEDLLRQFLNDAFMPICKKLAEVACFLRHPVFPINEEGNAGLEAGIASCKGYVQFYRDHLISNQYPFLGTVNITIKMHVVEVHVPRFARGWRVIGELGEDPIETMHKVVNEHRRKLAGCKKEEMVMKCSDDRLNIDMLNACKHEKMKGWKGPTREKRILRREHAHVDTDDHRAAARKIIATLD